MFDSFDIPDRAAENPSTALQSCLVSLCRHNLPSQTKPPQSGKEGTLLDAERLQRRQNGRP